MPLTASQTLILRDSLIAQCAAAGATGLPLHTLRHGIRLAGFGSVDDDELQRHLHFLTTDGMLEVGGAPMAAALKRWTISAKGTRYAEENGLLA